MTTTNKAEFVETVVAEVQAAIAPLLRAGIENKLPSEDLESLLDKLSAIVQARWDERDAALSEADKTALVEAMAIVESAMAGAKNPPENQPAGLAKVALAGELDKAVKMLLEGTDSPDDGIKEMIKAKGQMITVAVAQESMRVHPRLRGMNRVGVDTKYLALPRAAWDEILEVTDTDTKSYESDVFDCDDFAVSFKAECSRRFGVNGVGVVLDYDMLHAYNVVLVVDAEGKVTADLIEPQTDQWGVGGKSGNSHDGMVYL